MGCLSSSKSCRSSPPVFQVRSPPCLDLECVLASFLSIRSRSVTSHRSGLSEDIRRHAIFMCQDEYARSPNGHSRGKDSPNVANVGGSAPGRGSAHYGTPMGGQQITPPADGVAQCSTPNPPPFPALSSRIRQPCRRKSPTSSQETGPPTRVRRFSSTSPNDRR